MTRTELNESTPRWQYRTLRFESGREFEEVAEETRSKVGSADRLSTGPAMPVEVH